MSIITGLNHIRIVALKDDSKEPYVIAGPMSDDVAKRMASTMFGVDEMDVVIFKYNKEPKKGKFTITYH